MARRRRHALDDESKVGIIKKERRYSTKVACQAFVDLKVPATGIGMIGKRFYGLLENPRGLSHSGDKRTLGIVEMEVFLE